jgi:hypothetical protein
VPIRKIPVSWTTGVGGVGVSNFYTIDSVDVTVELGTFFNAIKGVFPNVVTWQVPSTGDVLQIDNGKIIAGWVGGTAATVSGTSAAAYVAGTGAFVRWATSGVIDGRRVKGRTFLCPLLTGSFDTQGTLNNTDVTTLNAAAVALAGSGKLLIYSRPSGPGAVDGATSLVTGAQVPDKVTSLHTRRT